VLQERGALVEHEDEDEEEEEGVGAGPRSRPQADATALSGPIGAFRGVGGWGVLFYKG